jgi:molybdopterin synthase catalytic subunit
VDPLCLMVTDPINTEAVMRRITGDGDGALAVFAGRVRNHHQQRPVDHLEYHAYPEMAVEELRRIAGELGQRHETSALALVHRTGELAVGEISVLVVAAAAHRRPALACCAEAIEIIKRRLPVWKKEFFADGGEPQWIYGPDEDCAGGGASGGSSTDA